MPITHCDILKAAGGAFVHVLEAAVKQRQLSSRVKRDRKQDSYVLFLKMAPLPCLG